MPYELNNRLRGFSTLRVTGAGGTTGALNLSAFSTNTAIENVQSLIITDIKWSVLPATGTVIITRDALVVATLYETGHWPHDELNIANTANGTITVAVAGGGTALLTIRKDATYNVDTQVL